MPTTPEPFTPVDPNSVAVGLGSDFCTVSVETHEGAVYQFPDMSESELRRVIPESGRIPTSQPALMMVNVSQSIMSVHFRIVKEIRIGEEVVWACRA